MSKKVFVAKMLILVMLVSIFAVSVNVLAYGNYDSNIAFEAAVDCNSIKDPNYSADDVIDRIWGQSGPNGGEWASNETNPWVKLTWDDGKTISRIVIYDRADPNVNANTGIIEFSDSTTITLSSNCIPDDGNTGYVIDHNVSAQLPKSGVTWMKFTITGGQGSNVGLAEIKVYGTPISTTKANSAYTVTNAEIDTLMSHIDPNYPGLETVKQKYYVDGDKQGAAQALLDYYRNRTSVWPYHIDPNDPNSNYYHNPNYLYAKDPNFLLTLADYSLRKVLNFPYAAPGQYSPDYLGEDIDWYTNISNPYISGWDGYLNYTYQLDYLAKAYGYHADEEYVKEYISELDDWIKDCNVPKNQNGYLYTDGDTTVPWGTTFTGMIRAIVWKGTFDRVLESPLFTKAVLVKFLNSLWEHVDYSRHYDGSADHYMGVDFDHFIGGNWGLAEGGTIGEIACYFPEFKNSLDPNNGWLEAVAALFSRRAEYYVEPNDIDRDVYEDGMYYEESPFYADWMNYIFTNMNWYYNKNNHGDYFNEFYRSRVCDMLRTYRTLIFPTGYGPAIGDLTEPYNLRENRWLLDTDPNNFSNIMGRDYTDLQYILSGYTQGTVPAKTAYSLPDGGFYSMRSGWDPNAICMVLKSSEGGEFKKFSNYFPLNPYDITNEGCVHNERDNGTFELMAGGRMLTPDNGTLTYNTSDPNTRRWWYRRTANHQTLTVITDPNYAYGASTYCDPTLQLWDTSSNLDTLVVDNQSYTNLKHRRAVHFVDKKYYVIIDEATGSLTGTSDIHYQFAPGNYIYDPNNLTARTNFASGWNLLVKGKNTDNNVSFEEEEGWIATIYEYDEDPRPQFAYRQEKDDPNGIRFVTVLVPYGDPNNIPSVSIGDITGNVGADDVNVEVTVDGKTSYLGYDISQGDAWIGADPNNEPSPELLANSGFDLGMTNWAGYNDRETLTVVTDPDIADNARSMKVSGRLSTSDSAGQDVRQILIDNGKGLYYVSASAKLASGTDDAWAGVCVQDPNGSYSWIYASPVSANSTEFKKISGVINLTWNGTTPQWAKFYVPTTNTTCNIYIDNLSLKKQALTNATFEQTWTTGWNNSKGGTITQNTDPNYVHWGLQSVRVSGRSGSGESDDSPVQDITNILKNNGPGKYRISVWVKLENGSSNDVLAPYIYLTDSTGGDWIGAQYTTVTDDGFTECIYEGDVDFDGLTSADVYFYTDLNSTLYVDDFSLVKID